MSSQNDKPFNDEDVFDAEITDIDQPVNLSGADIKDISDESIEDISDYDDSEEGIFAAAPAEKKKSSSSSFLLGTVALIALLGAGGFYVSQTPELLEKVKGLIPTASIEEAIAPVADIAGQPAVAVGDAELAAIPQPQPIVNVADPNVAPVATPVVDAPVAQAPAPETPLTTSAEPPAPDTTAPAEVVPAPVSEIAAAPADAPVETATAPDMPAPPTPEETQAAVVTSSAPAPAATQTSMENVPSPEADKTVVTADTPAQTDLAPATQAVSETKAGQSSADGVTKPAATNDAVYFDSPGGKILENLPTPSMNAKRGAGESIIVVKNAGSKKTAVKKESSKSVITTSTTQESRVVAANRALRLGRYDAALDIYNQLYKDNPRDGRILMGRAVALQKLGQIPEAIEAYESVLDMDSDNPEAIVNLMGLIRKEYPAVALEKLLGLQERHPKNPAIIAQLGIAYADAGNLEQATATLNRAVILDPNNAQHYFNLAVIAERMKDRPRAIELYERALETDAVYGSGRAIDRNMIYDRLTRIRS